MTHMVVTFHVERFRRAIERKLGLSFDDDKRDFLAEVLRTRLERLDESGDVYLARLESKLPHSEWSVLVPLLTVPETYFFRHNDQFEALAAVALPERIRAQQVSGRLSILSAGCASGEEAYSIAVLAREAAKNLALSVTILAIDINPEMIKKARAGRYSARSVRQTSIEMQHKLFGQRRQDYILDETIHDAVHFEERNIAEDDSDFWFPETFDIIFCRNVIMYFSAEQAQILIDRFARALVPDGYLFLGHAENLRGLSQAFHVCHTHETFYYRRRSYSETGGAQQLRQAARNRIPTQLAGVVSGSTSWVDAIRNSAERVQALAEMPAGSRNVSKPDKPQWNLGLVFDLLRRERFDEALDAVRSLPVEAADDADAVLLHAVLCAHSGQLPEAEQVCQHLLHLDELNAGAHYVLAICCEGVGNNNAAISHDQTAIYLDPTFAMPRLHLGLLARRVGDCYSARRELQQALFLLQREELARLLLFGGGFGREALLALCRAELKACGT